jgi:HSP20 family protein
MLPILLRDTSPLDEQLDHLFGTFFHTGTPLRRPEPQPYAAALDIYEEADRFEVWLDLPGFSQNEVKVELEGDTLTIKGERPARAESANENLFRRVERWSGQFSRTLTLPNTVDTTRVDANLKDGVLRLVLAKREQAKPRQISISS